MHGREKQAKSILNPQTKGSFLAQPPYPLTHALSSYTGCSLGHTLCGTYCYARFLPNWGMHMGRELVWGDGVEIKVNTPALLDTELARLSPHKRMALRIFMSSVTDPYQPLDNKYRLTHGCLEVFGRYTDLDLLVVQTRSTRAREDFDLLSRIPYAWLSVTIESDNQVMMERLRAWPPVEQRFEMVAAAVRQGIPTQIVVSPCLPHTPHFAERLVASGARRVIVDTFVDGDGSAGRRTAQSPFAQLMVSPAWAGTAPANWRATDHAERLYADLVESGMQVGWSAAGFCGIPLRPDR